MNDPVERLKSEGKQVSDLPHDLDSERELLATILNDNQLHSQVREFLKPQHFYLEAHQKIFAVISDLVVANRSATPKTLGAFFANNEIIGGRSVLSYLSNIQSELRSAATIVDLGVRIYEASTRRSLVDIGSNLVDMASDSSNGLATSDQIEQTQRRLFSLGEKIEVDQGTMGFESLINQTLRVVNSAYQPGFGKTAIATHIRDLDILMGGLHRRELTIIAARPGSGKTCLASNIAYNIAKNWRREVGPTDDGKTEAGGVVGFISLEMSSEQLATRVLSEQSGVPAARIRNQDIKAAEFEKIVLTSQEMHSIPLYIDQTGGLSIEQLAARARRLKRQKGLDVLIVDYLQLLQDSSTYSSEERVLELTEITTGLKELAENLNIVVIAISTLPSEVDDREDRRPNSADLEHIGVIESKIDTTLFLYSNHNTDDGDYNKIKSGDGITIVEAILAKSNRTDTGSVLLEFNPTVGRFADRKTIIDAGEDDVQLSGALNSAVEFAQKDDMLPQTNKMLTDDEASQLVREKTVTWDSYLERISKQIEIFEGAAREAS